MNFLKSLVIMLSLYTKIPMPFLEWNEKSTRYVLTWFPLSGVLIGTAEAGWFFLNGMAGLHTALYAAVSCAIPLVINGGIHLDGLADTADARASHAGAERKREILADPHLGAFGAAAMVIYEIMLFGIFSEIHELTTEKTEGQIMMLLLLCFIVPRALVLTAASVYPPAVKKGILYTMTSSANEHLNLAAGLLILAVCTAGFSVILGMTAVIPVLAELLLFLYFGRMTIDSFGGISGDLCGWLIKWSEAVTAGAVIPALLLSF